MAMLIVFVLLVLGISNYTARQIIVDASIQQQEQVARLYEREIIKTKEELKEYTRIIAKDPQIKQYLYAITRIGADAESLGKLFAKKYGATTDLNIIIFSDTKTILLNNNYQPVTEKIIKITNSQTPKLLYLTEQNHLSIVTYSPIRYKGEKVGSVVVRFIIDNQWLDSLPRNPGSHIFIVKNNHIIATTSTDFKGDFTAIDNHINFNNERYRLVPIRIIEAAENAPQLWLAESETRLFSPLLKFNKHSLIIIISSSLILLFLGIIAIKRISHTIKDLVIAAEKMTQGEKPEIKRSNSSTEIAGLYNQFADMVDAIHERDRSLKDANEKLRKISITDELSQLYNRRHLADIFPKLQAQAERSQLSLCAILCDIDFFKKVNDKYGHIAGDQCLIQFSDLLRKITRANDYLFRMGGEEFLILSLTSSIDESIKLAEKICHASEASPVKWEDQFIQITVSCGISCSKSHHPSDSKQSLLSYLISSADHALYQAKNNGRNQVCTGKNENPTIDA